MSKQKLYKFLFFQNARFLKMDLCSLCRLVIEACVIRYLLTCWHALATLFLLFKVHAPGLHLMENFSIMHWWHLYVTFEYGPAWLFSRSQQIPFWCPFGTTCVFSTQLWPISYWHFTCLLHLSVKLINEQQSPHHSQSKVNCWISAPKTLKNPYHLQTVTFKLRGRKKNMRRKTESYVFCGLDNSISCGWEQKLTPGRFATGWFWLCT